MTVETKMFGGKIVEVKEIEREGVKVGLISGYIATWDIDRGQWGVRDKFIKGCFLESIAKFQADKRMVRFKDHHCRTVGGWKYESLKEDDKGLYGEAEINLDVQQGMEAYKLAKQGVLVDFSIGFGALEYEMMENDSLRTITKAEIWEGSIVDEPMNPKANVISVKSIDIEETKGLVPKSLEEILRKCYFSRNAAKKIVACLDFDKLRDAEDSNQRDAEQKAIADGWKEVIQELKK